MRLGWSEAGGDKPVSEAGSTVLVSGVSQADEHRGPALRYTYKTREINTIGTNSPLIINASD